MRIAALFPGQNSHAVGMGAAMADAFPVAAEVFAQAEQSLPGLTRLMREGPLEELTLTANQQPALVTASVAVYRAWAQQSGLTPEFAAGHSLGEYSALVASGALDLGNALRLTRLRGELMQRAVAPGEGAMSAVMGDPAVLDELLGELLGGTEGVVEIANLNAPTQTVISGTAAAVAAAGAAVKLRGLKAIALKVSAPFHCSLMEPAREGLSPALHGVELGQLAFPVVANVTARAVTDVAEVPDLLERQITGSVRWVETVGELARLGADTFIEFGQGTVLTGLVRRILPDARTFNIHTPGDLAAFQAAAQEVRA